MSTSNFQIAYEGDALAAGSMDVRDLAPALLALGELVSQANVMLNGDRAAASVKVEADFKRGSFEVSLLLDQTLIEHARQLLTHSVVDADALVKVLFGGGSVAVITGIIKIWKALRGEKPKQVTTINNTTIIQTGSGQILNHVDRTSADLYQNDSIRECTGRVLEPLIRPGIDAMVVRKDKQELERMTKAEASSAFEKKWSEDRPDAETLVNTRVALLRVIRLSFQDGQKWRFSDGTSTFSASIDDAGFIKRLDAREEGFYKGDVLRVLLKTVQEPTADKDFKAEYYIEKVLEHSTAMKQPKLPNL